MKQYTTQTQTLHVPGQENLLAIADRLVVAAETADGRIVKWEGEALSIEGDAVSWHLSTEETAALLGTSKIELTIFVGDEVYKTDTVKMAIKPSLWDNGEANE